MANVLIGTFVSDFNGVDGAVQIAASDVNAVIADYNLLSAAGNLVAPSGLVASANVGGGTFANAAYFWKITGLNANGETTASNEATVTVAASGTATLTWSTLPAGTTGVKVYRGTVTGTENKLIATLGAVVTYTDTGTAGSTASPPGANTASTAVYDEEVLWNSLRRRNASTDRALSPDTSATFRMNTNPATNP